MSLGDRELEELLGDDAGLIEAAAAIRTSLQAPLAGSAIDPAFRSELRRRLMTGGWEARGCRPWWRRVMAPPGLAWTGAAAGVALAAFVVWSLATQPAGRDQLVVVTSPLENATTVAVHDPIPVVFNQPMDHPSVEQAVSIEPATRVNYQWTGNTLLVQPEGGELAPNTQYTVTVAPSAHTAAGQPVPQPRAITFVTSPPAGPIVITTPPPAPVPGLTLERQVATGVLSLAGWSRDGALLWVVGATGVVYSIASDGSGGGTTANTGISDATAALISADGARIGYIRRGGGGVYTVDGSRPLSQFAGEPLAIGWAGDRLLTLSGQSVSSVGSPPPPAPVPASTPSPTPSASPAATPTPAQSPSPTPSPSPALVAHTSEIPVAAWFSPTGESVVYRTQAGAFRQLVLATGQDSPWGAGTVAFLGWSPDGRRTVLVAGGFVVVADASGQPGGRVALADLGSPATAGLTGAISASGQVLLSTRAALYTFAADGSGVRKLADGVYDQPAWSPAAPALAFQRDQPGAQHGTAVWTATVGGQPSGPAVSEAAKLLSQFMSARVAGNPDTVNGFLDASGRAAYAVPGMALTYPSDPRLTRQYTLFAQALPGTPSRVRFLVRLVLDHAGRDSERFDETIVLAADAGGGYSVDAATAGPHLRSGAGPEVLSLALEGTQLKLTFDSDLDQTTIARGIVLRDAGGHPLAAAPSYARRTISVDLAALPVAGGYSVTVTADLKDVSARAAMPFTANVAGR